MRYAFRNQPAKGLYLIYQLITTLLVRVPVWVLLGIPRSLRPRKSWDLRRVFWVKLIRHITIITSKTGPLTIKPNHLAIAPGANGVWVDPVPELVTSELRAWMSATSVSAVRIPGYWVHRSGSSPSIGGAPKPGEKVLYHLHGGAYIRLSAHPTDQTASIGRGILKHVESVHRVFSIEYRLSSHKPYPVAHPFPAALLDAIAGYQYLVDTVGFSPADIIVIGDSAGANLGLALTLYLAENIDNPDINIPAPPSALILLSPWCDFSLSHETPGSSSQTNIRSDYIDVERGGINYARDAFLGPLGMGAASHNRYISPASLHPSMDVDFKAFPKTFIVSGGAEVLLDQIRTLKNKMIKSLGEEKVRYHEAPDGIHDYIVFGWHEPERTNTLKEIAKWVKDL